MSNQKGGQNRTKVGLKRAFALVGYVQYVRQNRTKVGLKLVHAVRLGAKRRWQNRTKVGLKRLCLRFSWIDCGAAKSNQGGIETYTVSSGTTNPRARQNRTKVGLKHPCAPASRGSCRRQNRTKVGLKPRRQPRQARLPFGQNRTKVGLKHLPATARSTTAAPAKSNQGGIETYYVDIVTASGAHGKIEPRWD